MTSYETIRVEQRERVGLVTIDRPKALNALSLQVMQELTDALAALDGQARTGCIVITGSERAFAAGADIKEMEAFTYPQSYLQDFIAEWEMVARFRKPVVAAVAGYALGGGCEIAMMCDLIIAADNAQFGQPEIKLGVIPGSGGTQRLPRAVGKGKAMDLILTGRMMGAEEAERAGLVARIIPVAKLREEAIKVAETIAGMSLPALMLAKESINRAYETPLAEGVRFERRVFQTMFGTRDQKEGMAAFVAKRRPDFKHG
jgi:enoyl-CoA hydratase